MIGFRRMPRQHILQPVRPSVPPDDSAAAMAKWIVPSVGALVAILGFVVESAHQSMLGIDFGDLGVRGYVWSASQFTRDLLALLVSAMFVPQFEAIGSDVDWWLCVCALLLLPAVWWQGAAPAPGRWQLARSPRLALAVLSALCLARAVAIDFPSTRVENLLGRGANSIEQNLKPAAHAGAVEIVMLKRSRSLYDLTRCERVQKLGLRDQRACLPAKNYRQANERLFLEGVMLSAVFLLVARMLWGRVSSFAAVALLAPIIMYASLAPAYYYGKFIKPTIYDSATVQVRTDITAMPRMAKAGAGAEGKVINAIVLARDDKLLTLFVSQEMGCGAAPSTYEWVPWKFSASEIVLLREIAGLDVMAEKLKEIPCPPSAAP